MDKWLNLKYLDCHSFAVLLSKTSEWRFHANIYIYKTYQHSGTKYQNKILSGTSDN